MTHVCLAGLATKKSEGTITKLHTWRQDRRHKRFPLLSLLGRNPNKQQRVWRRILLLIFAREYWIQCRMFCREIHYTTNQISTSYVSFYGNDFYVGILTLTYATFVGILTVIYVTLKCDLIFWVSLTLTCATYVQESRSIPWLRIMVSVPRNSVDFCALMKVNLTGSGCASP